MRVCKGAEPAAGSGRAAFVAFARAAHSHCMLRLLVGARNGPAKHACSCPFYAQYAVCKHSLALAIGLSMTAVPAERDVRRVGTKKKEAGRPRKPGPAAAAGAGAERGALQPLTSLIVNTGERQSAAFC